MARTRTTTLAGLRFCTSTKGGHTAHVLTRNELVELPHSRATGIFGSPRATTYRIASVDGGWTLDEWDAVLWVQVARSRSTFDPYPTAEAAALALRTLRDNRLED